MRLRSAHENYQVFHTAWRFLFSSLGWKSASRYTRRNHRDRRRRRHNRIARCARSAKHRSRVNIAGRSRTRSVASRNFQSRHHSCPTDVAKTVMAANGVGTPSESRVQMRTMVTGTQPPTRKLPLTSFNIYSGRKRYKSGNYTAKSAAVIWSSTLPNVFF